MNNLTRFVSLMIMTIFLIVLPLNAFNQSKTPPPTQNLVAPIAQASSSNDQFVCKRNAAGFSTTYMKRKTRDEALFVWKFEGFSDYSPEKRCREVTNRLNRLARQGGGKISHGFLNGIPVICTAKKNGVCDELIYTLKPGDNAEEALEYMFGLEKVTGTPRFESKNCRLLINLDKVIRQESEISDWMCS